MLTKTQINDIFRIQKSCIGITHKKPPQADCNELLNKGKMLTFQELISMESMKYGYKISKGLVPEPIKRIMYSKGGLKTHPYNTRNKSTPNIQKHITTLFNRSFLCRSISTYNKLPEVLKACNSINSFNTKAKTHLLNLPGTS